MHKRTRLNHGEGADSCEVLVDPRLVHRLHSGDHALGEEAIQPQDLHQVVGVGTVLRDDAPLGRGPTVSCKVEHLRFSPVL